MSDLDVIKPIIANALQPEQMDRHAIMSRALRHGFTLRPQEGRDDDLNEYVYSFAREVFEAGRNVVSAEINALREDLERERMRLVACGVVAMADTPESAAKAREMHQDYRSASCDDVARCVDECMALRKERDALAAKLAELEGQEPVAIADGTFNCNCILGTPLYARPITAELPISKRLLDVAKEWVDCCEGFGITEEENPLLPKFRAAIADAEAYGSADPVNARLLEALERIADPRNIHFSGDAQVVARAAIAAAEARGVTGPKRLTDEEIETAARMHGTGGWQTLADMMTFARAIEAAVLGAQETKNGD